MNIHSTFWYLCRLAVPLKTEMHISGTLPHGTNIAFLLDKVTSNPKLDNEYFLASNRWQFKL